MPSDLFAKVVIVLGPEEVRHIIRQYLGVPDTDSVFFNAELRGDPAQFKDVEIHTGTSFFDRLKDLR